MSLQANANVGAGTDTLDTDVSVGADHTTVSKLRLGGTGVDGGLVSRTNGLPVADQDPVYVAGTVAAQIALNYSLFGAFAGCDPALGRYISTQGAAWVEVYISANGAALGEVTVETVSDTAGVTTESDGRKYRSNTGGYPVAFTDSVGNSYSDGKIAWASAAAAYRLFVPVTGQFLRFRISTAFTGGTVTVPRVVFHYTAVPAHGSSVLEAIGTEGATPPTIPGSGTLGWLRALYDKSLALVTAFGEQGDFAAGNDTGPYSLMAFMKRLQGKLPPTVGPQGRYESLSVIEAKATNTSSFLLNDTSDHTSAIDGGLTLYMSTPAGTYSGTFQLRLSYDGGTTWSDVTWAMRTNAFNDMDVLPYVAVNEAINWVFLCQGATHYNIKFSSYTSGSTVVTVREHNRAQEMARVIPLNVARPVLGVTGSGLLNTDLITGVVSGWYEVQGARSFSAQIVGGVGITAGQITFEHTNDTTLGAAIVMPVNEPVVLSSPAIISAFAVAANASRVFTGPCPARYMRIRISTAFTGGTVSARVRFSPEPYQSNSFIASGGGSAITASVSNATVTSLNAAGLVAVAVLHAASSALTTTTNTATVVTAPANQTTAGHYQSAVFGIVVTVVTGTSPTLDLIVQETYDGGTNWSDIYHFPRITAVGNYQTPPLRLQGNGVRFRQVVGGTTPSFTRRLDIHFRSIQALVSTLFFDRTLVPNTGGSATPAFPIEGASVLAAKFVSGAATTPCTFKIQVSDDGTNWTDASAAVGSVASTTTMVTSTAGSIGKFGRVVVGTAGTGQALTYVSLMALDA